MRFGQIDENLTACRIELKPFVVDRQRDIGYPLQSSGIDRGQTAAAVADHDLTGGGVDANVVGVLAKIDPPSRSIICSGKNAHRSVAGVGDIKRIRRGKISKSLRLQ